MEQESGQPGLLPLDMEAWADAVVERCLVIVEAMETPDNRSADRHSGSDAEMHTSFLLATDVSMFRCVPQSIRLLSHQVAGRGVNINPTELQALNDDS